LRGTNFEKVIGAVKGVKCSSIGGDRLLFAKAIKNQYVEW